MKVEIIKSESQNTNTWAGGTTTQLFIYPRESEYKAKTFDFRLSTATVELEYSEFTPLPGISRILMVLDGEIVVKHKNQHQSILKPLDIDRFEGGWETSSTGQCTDFNLMLKGNCKGALKGLVLKNNEECQLESKPNSDYLFIYLSKGQLLLDIGEEKYELSEGDLLSINLSAKIKVDMISETDSVLAVTDVSLK